MKLLCGALLLAALTLTPPANAQYGGGGQYPPGGYPPGQYPPGQDPSNPTPNGGGLSIPHRHKKGEKGNAENALNTIAADGFVTTTNDKKLVVVVDDGRTLTMSVDSKVAFTKDSAPISSAKIQVGSFVHVVAAEDDEAYLSAVSVALLKDPPPQAPASSEPGTDKEAAPPVRAVDPQVAAELAKPAATDAPDRPILRRRKPSETSESAEDETPPRPATTASAAPAPKATTKPAPKKNTGDFTITTEDSQHPKEAGDDEQIARSREWADTFTKGLPNYVVQQITTRYQEESTSSGWTPLDVVTAKVVVEDGHEDYREITVGGKRTNKSMMDIGGSRSTGEFAGYLQTLLLTPAAKFKFIESTSVSGTPCAVYNFVVPLNMNRQLWTIIVGGQSLQPRYSGSVTLEKATGQVRRIEFGADKIPKDFPDDKVEAAVDYESIRLGSGMFLLPVHAANIACRRGTSICNKNEIDFRDYHKYTGESTIVYK